MLQADSGGPGIAEVLARSASGLASTAGPRDPSAAAEKEGWHSAAATPAHILAEWSAARRAYARGDGPRALLLAWRILEKEPAWPPALHLAGVVYYRLRRHGDAVVALEAFLAAAPAEVEMARAMGHSLYALGRFERAREVYGAILEQEEEPTPQVLLGAALCEYRLGRPDPAAELLDRCLAAAPRDASAWNWRARLLLEGEQPEAALEALEQARRLDPFEPATWNLLGSILLDLGREGEAERARVR
jgi:tetratricopeptide (TPR) repeat protein